MATITDARSNSVDEVRRNRFPALRSLAAKGRRRSARARGAILEIPLPLVPNGGLLLAVACGN